MKAMKALRSSPLPVNFTRIHATGLLLFLRGERIIQKISPVLVDLQRVGEETKDVQQLDKNEHVLNQLPTEYGSCCLRRTILTIIIVRTITEDCIYKYIYVQA